MGFWFITFNYAEVLATLFISMVVIVLGWLLFSWLWLSAAEMQVPTSYYKNEYKFEPQAGFITKMRVLIADILNHDYWIKHVGFDGKITRLLLSTVPEEDHHHSIHVPHLLYHRIPDLLPRRKNHESGVRREHLLQRHGYRGVHFDNDLYADRVHAHVTEEFALGDSEHLLLLLLCAESGSGPELPTPADRSDQRYRY
jgi:hypothetical protein